MASDETRALLSEMVTQDLFGPADVLTPETPPMPRGYELLRAIGRGGGGAVYLARDVQLERPVAIKFLQQVAPADLERFRREARFAARLTDPAIVKIYEMGRVADQPYIAMQYLDGGSLADAQLSTADVVRVLRTVAGALGHAHREGIVHRDLKPANILLDRLGNAYLADFGIARDLSGAVGRTLSHAGQIIGTPGLMSPEQARGEPHAVDARSDVYALGATLFRTLTGRDPFGGAHLVDVLHAIVHQPPPLARRLTPDIPRALEAIMVKCMQKKREDRYQSMADVIADFDRHLDGRPVSSESAAWFRTLVASTDAPIPVREDEDELDDQDEGGWSAGMEVVRAIATWDTDLYRVSGSLTRSFERLDALEQRLDRMLAERPDLAWARFYRGVVLFRRGALDAAREDMERAVDRMPKLTGAWFELGRLYLALYLRAHHRAWKHISQTGVEHDLDSARRLLEQAVLALRRADTRDPSMAWRAEYADAVSRLGEADYDGCVAVCDGLLEREPDREEIWKLRGDAQHFAGEDAIESYERALDVRRTYFEALLAKADAHRVRGELDAAREDLERALQIHPRFADALTLLTRVRLAEAERSPESRREALELAERACALDPLSYDATVLMVEVLLPQSNTAPIADWHQRAQSAVEHARSRAGCQNRVNLLDARVGLARARELRRAGRDPCAELERIDALARQHEALMPPDTPWSALRAEIEHERTR